MTDRISHLTVVLKEDVREDDLDGLCNAIMQLKNVLEVSLGRPVNVGDHLARVRVGNEWRDKLVKLAYPEFGEKK